MQKMHRPNVPAQDNAPLPEIAFYEEEISDVSLATFYVFDKENSELRNSSIKLPIEVAEAAQHEAVAQYEAAEAAAAAAAEAGA
jgi:hypothetical protein